MYASRMGVLIDFVTLSQALYQYHRSMFKKERPDLLVCILCDSLRGDVRSQWLNEECCEQIVDSWSGFGVRLARHFGIPYIINSPDPLDTLEAVGMFSALSQKPFAWNEVWNCWLRGVIVLHPRSFGDRS
jgi:hypothetical protein